MNQSLDTRIRLTPLGRSLLLPPKVQLNCIGRSARLLRSARSAMDFGLALARDGHHAGARECFRQAVVDLRAARGRLGVLFAEDWRHQ